MEDVLVEENIKLDKQNDLQRRFVAGNAKTATSDMWTPAWRFRKAIANPQAYLKVGSKDWAMKETR